MHKICNKYEHEGDTVSLQDIENVENDEFEIINSDSMVKIEICYVLYP